MSRYKQIARCRGLINYLDYEGLEHYMQMQPINPPVNILYNVVTIVYNFLKLFNSCVGSSIDIYHFNQLEEEKKCSRLNISKTTGWLQNLVPETAFKLLSI